MIAGKRLDKWFHLMRWLKDSDICPDFSTDWKWVHYALEPLFNKPIELDGLYLVWDTDAWRCELEVISDEGTASVIKYGDTPLSAIINASGELIGQFIGGPDDEPKRFKKKKKRKKKKRKKK